MAEGAILFQRGKVWYYEYHLDGKRVRKSTGETVYARANVVASREYDHAVFLSRGTGKEPTLLELARLWITMHSLTRSPGYVRAVELWSRRHLHGLGDLLVSRLDTETVERARVRYLRAGASKSSANQWLRLLRMLIGYAVAIGRIKQCPFTVRPLKLQKTPKQTLPPDRAARWLEELDRLSTLSPGVPMVVRLILGLGLRVSEACSARWEWYDAERGIYTPGKTKGKEADALPVPEWLAEWLAPRIRRRGAMARQPSGRNVHPEVVRRIVRRANRKYGTQGITPHRLRGTYATLLSEAGVPIQGLQQLLRHKSNATTMIYLERDRSIFRPALRRVAERMRFSRPKTSQDDPQGRADASL